MGIQVPPGTSRAVSSVGEYPVNTRKIIGSIPILPRHVSCSLVRWRNQQTRMVEGHVSAGASPARTTSVQPP